jgi:hypothetical protein
MSGGLSAEGLGHRVAGRVGMREPAACRRADGVRQRREHDRSHAARRLRSSDEAGRPPELAALLSRMLARHSALITTTLILIAAPSSNLSTTYMFLLPAHISFPELCCMPRRCPDPDRGGSDLLPSILESEPCKNGATVFGRSATGDAGCRQVLNRFQISGAIPGGEASAKNGPIASEQY